MFRGLHDNSMASSDTSTIAAEESEGTTSSDEQLHQLPQTDDLIARNDTRMQLAAFRAARQQRAVAEAARHSERKAGALAVGSATQELRREQERCQKAVKRANKYKSALEETQSSLKQQQYINGKLQQHLASTQAAAKIAATRSSSCISSLRHQLQHVETETSSKLTQGQQQVQRLIALTKQLQACVAAGNSSSSQTTRTISSMFQALAALGSLLVPPAAVTPNQHAAVDAATADATADAASALSISLAKQQLAFTDSVCRNMHSSLPAPSAVQQVDAVEKALLQQQCDELQQQTAQHATTSHQIQVSTADHLAKVAAIEAEKLRLQEQVKSLQCSLALAHSELQALRKQHHQQASRLSDANDRVLQLSAQLSKCEAELQQQQQDAASALHIVSSRDSQAANCAETTQEKYAAVPSSVHRSLSRPWSAAAAEVTGAGLPGVHSLLVSTCARASVAGLQKLAAGDSHADIPQCRAQQHLQSWQAHNSNPKPAVVGVDNRSPAAWSLPQQQEAPKSLLQSDQQHLHTTLTFRPCLEYRDPCACQHATEDNSSLKLSTGCGIVDRPQSKRVSSRYSSPQPIAKAAAMAVAGHGGGGGCGAGAHLCASDAGATAATQLLASLHDQGSNTWMSRSPCGLRTEAESLTALGAVTACRTAGAAMNNVSDIHDHMQGDHAGSLTKVSRSFDQVEQQQQQQPTAAERHRALVADADAALARLAACRRAANITTDFVGGFGGIQSSQAVGGRSMADSGVGNYSSLLSRLRFARAVDTSDATAVIKQHTQTVLHPSTRVGRVTCEGTIAGLSDAAAVHRVAGPPVVTHTRHANWQMQGHDEAGQFEEPDSLRGRDLQEELDALEHDFAHAEAQLQAASARLSGRALVC